MKKMEGQSRRVGRRLNNRTFLGMSLLWSLALSACSTGRTTPQSSEEPISESKLEKVGGGFWGGRTELLSVPALFLQNLHFRRPVVLGAEPGAATFEKGYKRFPLPNARLDCEPLRALFAGLDLRAVRACLLELQQSKNPVSVAYRLKRKFRPELELDLEQDPPAPACLEDVLPVIPVPREIYFQAPDPLRGQGYSCFNSRLPVQEEEVFGIQDHIRERRLTLSFPLPKVPAGPNVEEQMTLLLGTWAITPLFQGDEALSAKVVPSALCLTCLGEKAYLKDTDPEPPLWP
jgi:hypothetical protein